MRLYLDTSVIGGFYDSEFHEWTKPLIEDVLRGKHIAIISDITIKEIQDAPRNVVELLDQLIKSYSELVTSNDQTEILAAQYINEGVLSNKSVEDANHIALATISNVNAVVSWNFKHLVNMDRIRLFNSVNLKYGYGLIDIRSPREITGL
ncbi:MAG: PIN domain-containing protein [Bacteroidota bacterium]|nr:PIN domain-containing protein [Bacteroidota bacterium]